MTHTKKIATVITSGMVIFPLFFYVALFESLYTYRESLSFNLKASLVSQGVEQNLKCHSRQDILLYILLRKIT